MQNKPEKRNSFSTKYALLNVIIFVIYLQHVQIDTDSSDPDLEICDNDSVDNSDFMIDEINDRTSTSVFC